MSSLTTTILAPFGFAAAGALAVLTLEALWAKRRRAEVERTLAGARRSVALAGVASVALALAIYAAASMWLGGTLAVFSPSSPMLQLDSFSSYAMVLIGVAAMLAVWLSITYLPVLDLPDAEFFALLLLSVTGMFVMVASIDLLSLYVGVELTSLPLYAMAGLDRRLSRSTEAALKYFLTGGFASALLLYGIALLYAATGHTDFVGLRPGLEAGGLLATTGIALVIGGLAFKLALAPFHQWVPDVYEGAPTAVTAFLAVAGKVAAFVAVFRFLLLALPPEGSERISEVLALMAGMSMIVGNAMALVQRSVKRMLAYSSIAHAGFLTLGLVVTQREGAVALLFYLFAYLFMTLGAFGALMTLARGGRDYDHIDDFAGLAEVRPALAAITTLFMLSLTGIPGTVGFIAKFTVLKAAVAEGWIVLALIGAVGSVVSAFYYLKLPIAMYMRPGAEELPSVASSSEVVVLLVCAGAVLVFGFAPDLLPLDAMLWTFGIAP